MEQVSLKPMHKLSVRIVTLAFDLAAWLLHVTHSRFMMIVCANNFQKPPCMKKLRVGRNS